MAFGTGQHATTAGCLELIDEATVHGALESALDLGTGSGILAIALAKLGAQRVCAVDEDPKACEIARANILTNRVDHVVKVFEFWPSPPEVFDLIVANLFTDLLVQFSGRISHLLGTRGTLICSGFTEGDRSTITATFACHDLDVTQGWTRDGWSALMLQRAARQ
jgi:ribosomal protein L11 methyltransferase